MVKEIVDKDDEYEEDRGHRRNRSIVRFTGRMDISSTTGSRAGGAVRTPSSLGIVVSHDNGKHRPAACGDGGDHESKSIFTLMETARTFWSPSARPKPILICLMDFATSLVA
jgi:hypothetical protein